MQVMKNCYMFFVACCTPCPTYFTHALTHTHTHTHSDTGVWGFFLSHLKIEDEYPPLQDRARQSKPARKHTAMQNEKKEDETTQEGRQSETEQDSQGKHSKTEQKTGQNTLLGA